MPEHVSRESQTAARLESLEALEAAVERRADLLLQALTAGCALIALADGQVVPAETRRLLGVARTDPLLSLLPREAVLAGFAERARALALDPRAGRAEAVRRIAPLAAHPRLARAVLDACLAVTRADERVHPREVAAVRLVRDALGLGPDPGGAPARPGPRGDAAAPTPAA